MAATMDDITRLKFDSRFYHEPGHDDGSLLAVIKYPRVEFAVVGCVP